MNLKTIKKRILLLLLCLIFLLPSCSDLELKRESTTISESSSESSLQESDQEDSSEAVPESDPDSDESESDESSTAAEDPEPEESSTSQEEDAAFDLSEVPDYDGSPYVEINDNVPYFTEADKTTEAFETYSDLDSLGRCGTAYANLCPELEPTEERQSIGMIKPSGWHLVKYDFVDGKYLYNRCHLIAFMLAGENANEENLITGTRYLNIEGMLPFETQVDDYIDSTGNHVLYRVTPIFEGDNLVASGVLMEAESVEDDTISFCVYCYNVQPGVAIEYSDGDNCEDGTMDGYEAEDSEADESSEASSEIENADTTEDDAAETTYICNTNTMKFHRPECSSVGQMAEHNKMTFTGTRDEVIAMGYEPCKNCDP